MASRWIARFFMKALIIVDLQRAFPPPDYLVKRIRVYARRFDCRIFTRFINPPGSLFRKKLGQTSCLPNTMDTALLIEPEPGDLVLSKTGYGLKPSQIAKLRALGLKKATLCGVDTDACVLGVLFSLFDAGIDCTVKRELCWSSSGLHQEAMAIIAKQFPPPKRGRT